VAGIYTDNIYGSFVRQSQTGIVIKSDTDLIRSVRDLINDSKRRKIIINNSRTDVENNYLLENNIKYWHELMEMVVTR